MDKNLLIGIIGILVGIISIVITLILKEKKKLKRSIEGGFYYEDGDTDNPYCPNCYAKKRKRILIDKNNRKCPKCKTVFERPAVVIEVCPKHVPKFRI